MRLIKNSGSDRVIDELRQRLVPQGVLDIASPAFSLFAFGEIQELLSKLAKCRLVVPAIEAGDISLLGTMSDRTYRNRLQARWLARQCAAWLEAKVDVKNAPGVIPQATLITGGPGAAPSRVITGNCPFTTEGLGITPGNQLSLIQAAESAEECAILSMWFTALGTAFTYRQGPDCRSLPGSMKSLTTMSHRLSTFLRSTTCSRTSAMN